MGTVPVETTRSERTAGSVATVVGGGCGGTAEAPRITASPRITESARITQSARAGESARIGEPARTGDSARTGEPARTAEAPRSAEAPRTADSARSAPADGSGKAPEQPPPAARRRTARAPLLVAVALLLLAVVHQARPAPYGDRLAPHARVDHARGTPPPTRPPLRTAGGAVEAYDAATGRARWTYAREGHRPLAVLPARGSAIALWDDGLVTGTTRHDGSAVRWHRALPGATRWLADHGPTGVLRLLGDGTLAVITPERVVAYRVADGDLRWILPARPGCSFVPARAVRHGAVLLIARPCPAEDRWTAGLVAVDDLGIVAPHRAPLGNGRRGESRGAEHPHPGKVVAPPR